MSYKQNFLLACSTVLTIIFTLGIATPVDAADRPDLVIAVPKLARGLEPGRNSGNVDVRVIHSIYDSLIRRDFVAQAKTGRTTLVPGLAISWEQISPAELVLKLRQGVKWHDGTEFTAEDVAFAYGLKRVYGEGAPLKKVSSTLGNLARVEVLGPYEVKLVWKEPDPIMVHRLANKGAWIPSKAQYMSYAQDGVPSSEWVGTAVKKINWQPIGTGPYKFESYTPGESIKLVANDDYFMGAPAAKSITFVEVPEVASRIAGIVAGEFDMAADIPPDQVAVFNRYKEIKTVNVVRENTHVVVFNTSHPLLADKRIRQALALGIDRQRIIDTIWKGMTITPHGPQLEAFNEMFIEDAEGFSYDLERAKALLAEAGYTGEELSYRFIPGYYTLGQEAAQILQEMWREIGVKVALTPVENWKAVRTEDTMIYAWSNTYRFPDPLGQLALAYGPRSAIQKKFKYWANEEFTTLAMELERTNDLERRRSNTRRMIEIYMDEVPSTFLYNPSDTYAIRKGLEYTPTPQFFEDFRPDNLRVLPSN
jgi:peptide/nickel transport system substrate-binding protein